MKRIIPVLFLFTFLLGARGRRITGIYPEPRVKGYISTGDESYGSLIMGLRVPIPMMRNAVLRFNVAELAVGNTSWLSFNMVHHGNFIDLLYYFSRSRSLGLYGIGNFGFLFTENHSTFSLSFGVGAETYVSPSADITWELGLSLYSNSIEDSGAFISIGVKFE